mmetsp:Transcript_655/g.1531  ORF Transcript_655/g.1531 Transcript_655/m.1531 type:complete len:304 (-) Transcript_655:8-919(-)
MIVFFVAMVIHELALEAATSTTTSDGFGNLQAIAYLVTLFQFGFCILLPLLVSGGTAIRKFPRTVREILSYCKLSMLVFGATALASQSLHYVTYPTKVVFKSAKLIPTMMVSTLLHGKQYNGLDYIAAFLLCAGAAGYAYKSGTSGDDDTTTSMRGLFLLLSSIVCDAFVPNVQQQFLSSSVHATELMVNVNTIGFVGLFLYMMIFEYTSFLVAIREANLRLYMYLFMVGLGLSTAVLAYTKLIQKSGSVVAVAVATLRKVATMIFSYIFFPKPLLLIHVFSGFLVLFGLLLSSYSKQLQSTK